MLSLATLLPLALLASNAAAAPTVAKRAALSKKGAGADDLGLLANLDVSWQYSWSSTPKGTAKAGAEFVPMLWNGNAGTWATNAQNAINSGSTHLLGFNEPDLNTQANMDVATAASAWKANMSPFAGKATLVSPAVTNGASPMGVAWLESFRDTCPECWNEIDAVALHWYDSSANLQYFYDYLDDAYGRLGKPLWLTEFAGSGSSEQQQEFLRQVIPWMEKTDFIERYAGFGAFAGNYVNADASLTPLGQVYSDTV
ncbi:hypothetical protein JCM6882_002741 [Rhodosporidiobolus microsporus]